jgi:hypothetical protein
MGVWVDKGRLKRDGYTSLGMKSIIAGVLEYLIVSYFRWFPMKYVYITAIVLIVVGLSLMLLGVIKRYLRTKEMSIGDAKKYLKAFVKQYERSNDIDIQNLITAILIIQKAGILENKATDNIKIGTINITESDAVVSPDDEVKNQMVTKMEKTAVQDRKSRHTSTKSSEQSRIAEKIKDVGESTKSEIVTLFRQDSIKEQQVQRVVKDGVQDLIQKQDTKNKIDRGNIQEVKSVKKAKRHIENK